MYDWLEVDGCRRASVLVTSIWLWQTTGGWWAAEWHVPFRWMENQTSCYLLSDVLSQRSYSVWVQSHRDTDATRPEKKNSCPSNSTSRFLAKYDLNIFITPTAAAPLLQPVAVMSIHRVWIHVSVCVCVCVYPPGLPQLHGRRHELTAEVNPSSSFPDTPPLSLPPSLFLPLLLPPTLLPRGSGLYKVSSCIAIQW